MKNLARKLFEIRSYTPIPFIILMIFFYNGSIKSWLIGLPIIILGEALRFWGVSYAGSITRTTKSVKAQVLVTSEPFAYVRNPLYIGNVLIYTGFGILSFALFPYLQIAALVWFVFQYNLIIGIEEEFLKNKFSDKYIEYLDKVPRIILKLFPDKSLSKQKPNYEKGLKSEESTLYAILANLVILFIMHLVK